MTLFIGTRKRWTAEELDILCTEYGKLQHPPSFRSIRRVQQLCPSLQLRSLAQIKSRAWALLGQLRATKKDNC